MSMNALLEEQEDTVSDFQNATVIDFLVKHFYFKSKIIPGTCASVSSWSPVRWCVGGPRSLVWSVPTLLCRALAWPAASAPSPPSSSSLDFPQLGDAWRCVLFHPAPLMGWGKRTFSWLNSVGIYFYLVVYLFLSVHVLSLMQFCGCGFVSYKEAMFTFSGTCHNTLCACLRANKHTECISFLINGLKKP